MVHLVLFFCLPGLFVLWPWDSFVLGYFVDTVSYMCTSVKYVDQCHICVPVLHICLPVLPGPVTGCQGSLYKIFGTIPHTFFCLFWCSLLTYYSKQTWYLFIYLSDLIASCLAYCMTLLGVERQHWWWLWNFVGLKDLSEIFPVMTVALRL
jgi:hypothetical protein